MKKEEEKAVIEGERGEMSGEEREVIEEVREEMKGR
jgi:hypothetical protein